MNQPPESNQTPPDYPQGLVSKRENVLVASALRQAGRPDWLNTGLRWWVPVTLVVAMLLGAAWLLRWDVTPINNGDRSGGAYVLDRFTGVLYFAYGFGIEKVEPIK
jgi:hypothetical protein